MKQLLVFVLFAGWICWFMFSPSYKHVLIMRQALLQKEVDYMLEIGANGAYGYIDQAAVEASRMRLEMKGFNTSELSYLVTTTDGSGGTNAAAPVLRGTGIQLEISYPYGRLFDIDSLLGIGIPSAGTRMAASGMKMSEYIP